MGSDPSASPLNEILDELDELVTTGLLSDDKKTTWPAASNVPAITTLALIMATDCNLRCRYCYADDGTYHQQRSLMDISVARQSVDFLVRKSRQSKEVGISFFGGEPMLNFRCMEKVVPYATEQFEKNGKECTFGITTNGTLLTPAKVKFMEDHHFSYIISIDGRPEIHDKNRILPDNTGSYKSVIRRLETLANAFPDFYDKVTIRATFTGQDHDLVSCLSHLHSLGFSRISIESCSAVPKHFGITAENLDEVLADYDFVAQWYLEQLKSEDKFSFNHFTQLLEQVAEGTRRISQCGAGRGYLAVSPAGVLYPCHRLVGNRSFAMGSVFTGTNPEIQHLFGSATVPYKPKCLSCWARYICGGGCHATAIQFNQNILQPYEIECSLMKHRIKLGAWLFSQLSDHYSQEQETSSVG